MFRTLQPLPIVLILLLQILFVNCSSDTKQPVDYVNPFIGTDAGGHTFPGACLPFGMVQLSPDNGYQGVRAYSYDQKTILGFSHTHLSGTGPFTKTHYNNVLILPTIGDVEIMPGVQKELNAEAAKRTQQRLKKMSDKEKSAWNKLSDKDRDEQQKAIVNEEKLAIIDDYNMDEEGYYTENTFEGYESAYSHQEEAASPGYYAVNLKDYGIKAELTATERVGFHRYTFPQTDNAHIILDVTHSLTPGREIHM